MAAPSVIFQPTLLDGFGAPDVDPDFTGLERTHLDSASWVDHVPGWVSSPDSLFTEILVTTEWAQRTRWMYDRRVDEPRLTSWWSKAKGADLPPVLERMRRVLSEHYGVELDSMGLNLYRHGRDSVAWHADRIPPEIEDPRVAIVSVGEPRKFLLRPAKGGPSRTLVTGRGDLLVTGGQTQRRWHHSVPKAAKAGPRISITFRHGVGDTIYRGKKVKRR
jgi:alkylated DNA repair dioxygenase AlkB